MFELTFPVNICAHIKCSWTFFAFISLGMNLLSGFLWKQSLWPGSLFLPLPQLLVIGQRVQNLTLQASKSPESGPFSFQSSSSSQHIKHPNSHKRKHLEILTVGKTSMGACIFLVRKSVFPKRDLCKAKLYYFLVHVYWIMGSLYRSSVIELSFLLSFSRDISKSIEMPQNSLSFNLKSSHQWVPAPACWFSLCRFPQDEFPSQFYSVLLGSC